MQGAVNTLSLLASAPPSESLEYSLKELRSWVSASSTSLDFAELLSLFFDQILVKTRFSQRFHLKRLERRQDSALDLKSLYDYCFSIHLSREESLTDTCHLVSLIQKAVGLHGSRKRLFLRSLPTFFSISFTRDPEFSKEIELPLDLDLGFLSGRCKKSLYAMHSFVTLSKQNVFITYTRIRGGRDWYRVQDQFIEWSDVYARVKSRGVVYVVYALV